MKTLKKIFYKVMMELTKYPSSSLGSTVFEYERYKRAVDKYKEAA